jgi:hypothetical protein
MRLKQTHQGPPGVHRIGRTVARRRPTSWPPSEAYNTRWAIGAGLRGQLAEFCEGKRQLATQGKGGLNRGAPGHDAGRAIGSRAGPSCPRAPRVPKGPGSVAMVVQAHAGGLNPVRRKVSRKT